MNSQEYKNKISDLNKQKNRFIQEGLLLDNKISIYEQEIKPLTEKIVEIGKKYNIQDVLDSKNKCMDELSRVLSKIKGLKLWYLIELINDVYTDKHFYEPSYVNIDNMLKNWLKNKFKIEITCEDYTFDCLRAAIFEEYIEDNNFCFFVEKHDSLSVSYIWYFRGEWDGQVNVTVPKDIIESFDSFIEYFQNEVSKIEAEKQKENNQKIEKAKEARYKTYLKLKQEFES